MDTKNNERSKEKLQNIFNSITIVISIIAIVISICTNKQQNKINLLDKRFEAYQQLCLIDNFLGDLNTVQQKTGISNLYSSLWWEEIAKPYFPEYTDAGSILKRQKNSIESIEFLFTLEDSDLEKIKSNFNVYYSITQNHTMLTDADFIIMWDEYKGNYQWNDLTDVMNKMKDEMKP